jgi:hypothetical protein
MYMCERYNDGPRVHPQLERHIEFLRAASPRNERLLRPVRDATIGLRRGRRTVVAK